MTGMSGIDGNGRGRNPVGVGCGIWRVTQGSGVAATLGYGTESRWDSMSTRPIWDAGSNFGVGSWSDVPG